MGIFCGNYPSEKAGCKFSSEIHLNHVFSYSLHAVNFRFATTMMGSIHDCPVESPGCSAAGGDVFADFDAGDGELEPDLMIHAVVWSEDEPVTPAGLIRTIKSVLQRAEDWGLARISTPILGTGPGALPLEDAALILVQTLTELLPAATYPKEVCIVVESEEDREVVQALLRGGTTQ